MLPSQLASLILHRLIGLYFPKTYKLINASDVVIGKAGYSTIAELYQAGVPFGYISRSNFREAQPLREFICREMNGIEISEEAYLQNRWGEALPALLEIPRIKRTEPNGADQIAQFIHSLLEL